MKSQGISFHTKSGHPVYRRYSGNYYITAYLDPGQLYSLSNCKYIECTVIIISMLIWIRVSCTVSFIVRI